MRVVAILLALAASLLGPDSANAAAPAAGARETLDALTRANAAVVGLQVQAAQDARSAQTLGRQRSGSGVVIGGDGLILTIGYLLLEADHIQITTAGGKSYPGRVAGYDLATGFGLVRPVLPLRGVTPVALGSLGELEPGMPLMAATGAQPDEDADVDMTRLVSKRAFSGYWEYHIETALFTSPPVGNHSGAPLFNARGELVGIGSLFVMDAAGANERLPGNMFVPVDLLKPILPEFTRTGTGPASRRPWLGLTSSDQGGRVQVVRVTPDSPAQAGGLRPGDVVLAVDGTAVSTLEAFYKQLWSRATPDSEVRLTVLQGVLEKTLVLKPVDRMQTLRRPAGI